MPNKKTTPERLATFSDGVFAVLITIMVLDLKPPAQPTLNALLPLWPTALSYAVSYFFIAIIWVNHHHFTEIHPQRHSSAHLVELRPSLYDFACTREHRLDGGFAIRCGSCLCLYVGICPDRNCLHRF
jgi:transmembrane protein TMEM174 (potassium channel)